MKKPKPKPPREAYDLFLERFANQLIQERGNATSALKIAAPNLRRSPSRLTTIASELSRHHKVVEIVERARDREHKELQAALERYAVSADRAAAELARLAYTELRQVADWGSTVDEKTGKREYWLHVRDAVEIEPDAHKAIVSVERRADGSLKVQLADKLAAQMNLARLKGWIQEKPTDVGNAVQLIIQR